MKATLIPSLVQSKKSELIDWILRHETGRELPLYSSVDIRNSGFKSAVVDTNLFPAGFNNLCATSVSKATQEIKKAILSRSLNCQNIIIIMEEHTRNTWYLENIRILATIIEHAGFKVKVATFFDKALTVCQEAGFIVETTAIGQPLKIYCLDRLSESIELGHEKIDFVVLNNDLTQGIPAILKFSKIPTYPSIAAGWHSRSKSHHFTVANEYLNEIGAVLGIDPWFISCLFSSVDQVSIGEAEDRELLADAAADLFKQIQEKYDEHGITEKPFIFLKSDSGTYGMGVIAVESPEDILNFNRKDRNRMSTGKGTMPIHRFILQEGVPSVRHIENHVGETCIYQIDNHFVGGFYRVNTLKNERQNLNSQGMLFKQICNTHSDFDDARFANLSDPIGLQTDCFVSEEHAHLNVTGAAPEFLVAPDPYFEMNVLLARVAGIAASKEVEELKLQASI